MRWSASGRSTPQPGGVGFYDGHIPQGLGIVFIDLEAPYTGISPPWYNLHAQYTKRKHQMGLDKMRIILYHPAKLQDRQVITAILGHGTIPGYIFLY